MQKLFEISPNDTAWLLNHVYVDGPVDLSQLIQSQIFSKFASALNSGLTVEVAIDTAKIILRHFPNDCETMEKANEIEAAKSDLCQFVS